jgi:hypothetical protein
MAEEAGEAADVVIGEEVVIEIDAPAAETAGDDMPFAEETMDFDPVPARTTYIDYLKSPIITLLVGQGDEQALLTAHQALLVQSPWFEEACSKFTDELSASHNAVAKLAQY